MPIRSEGGYFYVVTYQSEPDGSEQQYEAADTKGNSDFVQLRQPR